MMKSFFHKISLTIVALLFLSSPAQGASYKNNIAVTAHPLASQAAIDIYKQGGNAIDAAVAAAFALNVVEPHNSGIGGGGFMMIYSAKLKQVIVLDYRETAPAASEKFEYTGNNSRIGASAAAVPGLARGMEHALTHYGQLKLAQTLQPAIKLARDGFPVSPLLADRLINRANCLGRFKTTKKLLFYKHHPLKTNTQFKQADLANSLESIATKGADSFYIGALAKKLVAEIKKQGGLIREADLAKYQVKTREPIQANYKGYQLYLMPLPSSGGILLKQMLTMTEQDPLKQWGHQSVKTAHLLTEVMKAAFKDRSEKLGDADFTPFDAKLLDENYAKNKRQQIRLDRASPLPQELLQPEGSQTTHASFADQAGNVVAMTNSLNLAFGSCVIVPGTGILLNNHMDDFATQAGKANAFGLVQSTANRIQAGKRPLSSMSPTFIFKDKQFRYALGSPGGPTIISNVFQIIVNLLQHNMSLRQAIAAPKLHHQYLPPQLYYQERYPRSTLDALNAKGHQTKYRSRWGNVQAVSLDLKTQSFQGVSDPRGEGTPQSNATTVPHKP